MRQMKKRLSLFLAAVLLLTLMTPAALAAENTVTIGSAEDLTALAQKCSLDTWSQGKTVVLTADLDLKGEEFSSIPTFGGTFQGNGHTISGLSLTGSGNVRGLFRYLQSGAVVQDLTVKGTISPSNRQDDLGLLAGSNAGRILNCAAEGTVSGDNRIGGLVGTNEEGGELVSCTFTGSVTGKHSAGGVVGENHGTLTRCENTGSVNTKDLEDSPKTDYTNLAQLNSMENVPAYTDIGGVAGLSDGVIQSCTNSGAVGYDQIGYNVGGIAGRQSGWLDGCINTGAVSGRKDVGGVVGQLEPEVLETFSEDFLDRLLDQLTDLQDVMDRTVNDADGISNSVHSQLTDLSQKARDVKEIAGDLTDQMTDWANGNIDEINELSARVSWSMDQLSGILDDAVEMTDDLDTLVNRMEVVRKDLENASDSGDDVKAALDQALKDLQTANTDLQKLLKDVSAGVEAVLQAIQGGDAEEILAALKALAGTVSEVRTVLDDLETALAQAKKALNALSDMTDNIKDALEDLEYVNDSLGDVVDGLSDVTVGLRNLVKELSEKPDITIQPIGSDITDQGDRLQDAMDALLDSGDALNQLVKNASDTLVADLKAINSQFRAITNLIRSEKADWDSDSSESLEDRIKDRFQDVSDSCDLQKQHDGRVSGCENRGTVRGDKNLGGVIGSIGIETDFDEENDVTKVGKYSLDFHYQARALVSGCVNYGEIDGKNDCAGGVVGQAWLGRVTGCEGYGTVSSSDGSYVGGVAGSAEGSVDNSWAKCAVSGEDYVGGIAGYADTLTACHTLVTVEGAAYTGALAGDVSEDGTLKNNTFTHETLGAVDGISYTGKAEPVAFETLCGLSGAPRAFTQLELTFRADGEVVQVVPFQYGRGIDSLPEIPAKKGCSASWPDLDYTHLTASQTLDAVYTPYQSALTDGDGDLPQILVDGSFSSRAEVSHSIEGVSWVDAKGNSHSGDAVTVTVDDPDMKEISYTVHYRLPESGKRYTLWVQNGDTWEQQESTVDGSYLLFSVDSESVTFCVQEHPASMMLWVILGILAAAAVLLVIFLLRRKRGKVLKIRLRRLKKSTRVQ